MKNLITDLQSLPKCSEHAQGKTKGKITTPETRPPLAFVSKATQPKGCWDTLCWAQLWFKPNPLVLSRLPGPAIHLWLGCGMWLNGWTFFPFHCEGPLHYKKQIYSPELESISLPTLIWAVSVTCFDQILSCARCPETTIQGNQSLLEEERPHGRELRDPSQQPASLPNMWAGGHLYLWVPLTFQLKAAAQVNPGKTSRATSEANHRIVNQYRLLF